MFFNGGFCILFFNKYRLNLAQNTLYYVQKSVSVAQNLKKLNIFLFLNILAQHHTISG